MFERAYNFLDALTNIQAFGSTLRANLLRSLTQGQPKS